MAGFDAGCLWGLQGFLLAWMRPAPGTDPAHFWHGPDSLQAWARALPIREKSPIYSGKKPIYPEKRAPWSLGRPYSRPEKAVQATYLPRLGQLRRAALLASALLLPQAAPQAPLGLESARAHQAFLHQMAMRASPARA